MYSPQEFTLVLTDNNRFSAYGKVERITRSNGSVIVFGYDGMQNRIMKAVRTGVDTVFTFYVGDAQGNVLGVYNRTTAATPTITWAEQHIYGSGRLGSINPGIAWTAESIYAGFKSELVTDFLRNGTLGSITGMVGSANITITPTETGIRVSIFNITSITSGTLGAYSHSQVHDHERLRHTPYGNISQRFSFTLNHGEY